MSRDEIRKQVEINLAEITDADTLSLTDATTPDEVSGWDSVNHIKLIFALEEALGINFPVEEMTSPDDLGAFLDLIQSRL